MPKLTHLTILDEFTVNMEVILGQGSTGCVYQGTSLKNNTKVAIKIIDLRTITNEVARYLLNMEKHAIMSINSNNVLRGFKAAEDNRYCYIITEFCNGPTLKKYIRNSPDGYLSEGRSLQILRQVLLGYRGLVEKGIVHRDLKPANIMLHNDVPKIIDFGYCEIKGFAKPKLEYNVGSPSYMAPESFQYNIYNEKTEIWAIGIILFQCITGKTIDEGRHMSEVYREIEISGVYYPSHVSYFVRNIINWCLCKNPKHRPTCQQLLDTYFISRQQSKPKFSPHKTSRQEILIKNYERVSSYNQSIGKSKSPIREKQAQFEYRQLLKSGKMETKPKNYKVPEFLQSNMKAKRQTTDNKENFIRNLTPHRLEDSNDQRQQRKMRPSKSNKEYKVYDEHIHARTTAAWEYGRFRESKGYGQYIEPKRAFNIDDIYRKISKDSNVLGKARFFSTHTSPVPAQVKTLNQSPSKHLVKNMSREMTKKKRTYTERLEMIRA